MKTHTSLNRIAKIAGVSLAIMFVFGIIADSVVFPNIIVWDDTFQTIQNMLASENLYRFGISCYAGDLLINIIIAMALYLLLRPVNNKIALLAAWFRLIYVAIRGGALVNLISALLLVTNPALETVQLHGRVMMMLNADKTGYLIGLIFFGFHVLLLGYLIYKSGYLPKIIGIILMVAFIGYITNSFAYIILPNYKQYETVFFMILAVPGVLSELSLCLWLLIKGVNSK